MCVINQVFNENNTRVYIQPRAEFGSYADMGHYNVYQRSLFNTMLDEGDTVQSFDFVFNVISKSDTLRNDTANFMKDPPELNTPLYESCHEEIFMLMWYTKYAQEVFLPFNWFCLHFINESRTCFRCSREDQPQFTISPVYSFEDVDELQTRLFTCNNYCVGCRRILFDVLDVEEEVIDKILRIKTLYRQY